MRKHRQFRGFTLAETLVVVALTAIVGGALLSAVAYIYRNNAYIFEATASVESARRGLLFTLEHIREAAYGDDGSYPLSQIATSSITFYSDIDEDGGIERVRIYRIGEGLYREVTNAAGNPPSYTGQAVATSTLATYLRNGTSTPLFVYYDNTGSALSTTSPDVSQVRSVLITIMTDLNPNRAPNVLTLTGSAMLRNLKD